MCIQLRDSCKDFIKICYTPFGQSLGFPSVYAPAPSNFCHGERETLKKVKIKEKNIMMDSIIGQILGLMATALTVLSYQMNAKRALLLTQTAATVCTCLSFLFLGASTGFALNIVCIVRNIAFYFETARTPLCTWTAVLMAAAMGVLGALSWEGAVSLLILPALMANTLILSRGNPQLLRCSVIVTSSLIFAYNACAVSVGGMLNEGLSVVSSVVGIVRFRKVRTTVARDG